MFVIYYDLFCEDCSKGRNIQALTVYYDVYSAFMWLSLLEQWICLCLSSHVSDSGMEKHEESRRDCKINHKVGRVSCNATLAQRERVFWGIFITLAVMNYCLCNHLLFAKVCLAALQASTLVRASRNKKRAEKWCDDRSENRKHPLLSNTQDAAKMLHDSAAQTVL